MPLRQSSVDRDESAFKTTEFVAYVVILAGIFIAGAITNAGSYGASHDPFRADRVWLYATVLTVGYLISAGSSRPAAASLTTKRPNHRPGAGCTLQSPPSRGPRLRPSCRNRSLSIDKWRPRLAGVSHTQPRCGSSKKLTRPKLLARARCRARSVKPRLPIRRDPHAGCSDALRRLRPAVRLVDVLDQRRAPCLPAVVLSAASWRDGRSSRAPRTFLVSRTRRF